MAKDRKKLQHIHSSIADKQPTPQTLEVGEIAVNNSKDQEFLSIKNTEDKVVRFSSDGQIIDWIERKEVMPYVGYVRGGAGPSATSAETPTKDAYGSYGIQTSDLTGNTSEIIIKLNQVAAEKTTKHNRVNGSKDRYNKDVNPTTDGGVNDGAGFYIDMSRYAMQGANPTFSGTTNTCYTNLNGTTKIKGVDGACGSLLEITVNSAKTDIETANTEITSATTVIGTNTTTISGNTVLNVSGTTTETKKGNVTEHNLANKSETTDVNLTELVKGNNYRDVNGSYSGTTGGTTTEVKTKAVSETNLDTTSIVRHSGVTEDNKSNVVRTTSGTTTETFKGQVTENNQSGYTVNTTGNVIVNTTGTTTELHNGQVTITNNSGLTETTKGNVVENVSGTTTINHSGTTTTNVSANTVFNTTGTTTINSNGTTTIQSTGNGSDVIVYAKDDLCETSDDVAAFKGANTTNIGSDCTNANQTKTLNVRANSADTRVTSAYTSATTATTIIGTSNASATTADYSGNTLSSHVKGLTHSGDTLNVTESTSTTIKSPTTTISGCTKIDLISDDLNFQSCTSAGTIDFNFCNGYNVNSNAVKFEQCSTAGTFTIKEKATTISGTTLDILEKDEVEIVGDNKVHIGGETVEAACDLFDVDANSNVCIESDDNARFYGANDTEVGVSCTNQLSKNTVIDSLSGTVVSSNSDTCVYGKNVNIGGDVRTRIGANCQGAVDSNYVDISATTSITETAPIIELSSSTTNLISNATNIDAISSVCVSAGTIACFYGKDTRIGMECDRTTIATATTIEGTTVGISGNTTNVSGATTLNLSGKTVNVDATDIDVDASNNYCLSAATKANIYGKATNIGIECGGTIATATTIEGTTVGISGGTTNVSGGTINISGGSITETSTGKTCIQAGSDLNIGGDTSTKVGANCDGNVYSNNTTIYASTAVTINAPTTNITGNTNISGDTVIGGNLSISGTVYGLKDLSFATGYTAVETPYNGSAAKSITIADSLAHISKDVVTDSNSASTTNGTVSISKAAKIASGLTVSSGGASITGATSISGNVSVTGTITATQAIYSSDINLKENIKRVDNQELDNVALIEYKSYNFKNDESKHKVYGVIAQEVQDAGLNELVYTNDDGTLAVDYTSLMILKLAKLTKDSDTLLGFFVHLQNKIEELEQKVKELENKD